MIQSGCFACDWRITCLCIDLVTQVVLEAAHLLLCWSLTLCHVYPSTLCPPLSTCVYSSSEVKTQQRFCQVLCLPCHNFLKIFRWSLVQEPANFRWHFPSCVVVMGYGGCLDALRNELQLSQITQAGRHEVGCFGKCSTSHQNTVTLTDVVGPKTILEAQLSFELGSSPVQAHLQ